MSNPLHLWDCPGILKSLSENTLGCVNLAVLNAKATSLNLLHDDIEILGYGDHFGDGAHDGHVLISPMEIQAYKLELRPH
ncbi:hypothetical protein KY285_014936 [Solanum tuberosum]|nr:hypothetical protein KY285_014936 [Solanum tuberosum]